MALADTRFATRRRALASKLAAQRIDSILVTSPIHVRYLTGFTGSNGALLLHKDLSARMCTDGRYTTQIGEEVPDIEAMIERASATALLATVEGDRRVAFEASQTTVAQLDALREAAGEDVQLIPVTGVVESIRLHKDPFEQDRLREVAAVASAPNGRWRRIWNTGCGCSAPNGPVSTRSWRPGRTRPSPTTGRVTASSSAVTWSPSTSVPMPVGSTPT